MDSKASAVWKGDLKGGSGTISANSGVLSGAAYTFATRFEGSVGTNPEELIAAAHAGCYSMALSNELASGGNTPDHVSTTATVTLEMVEGGPCGYEDPPRVLGQGARHQPGPRSTRKRMEPRSAVRSRS